ncbi:sodium:solute symporter family protein [Nitrospirillum sp. BR 11163]|uniref:sodium:solute symporter family protein n=1 Tax=Nitrospirillum sp. BR 11163 TaxID=3104323 RepID=UPI002AFF391D|nr:sodium:solute symporter [Nitrospirillum sp. BR 11163]MEA1672743.1 sodium:solute symporter [Nitrospirillum sp. BR 11163]
MIPAFVTIIAASLLLALFSKRGHAHQGAKEFFTASGQFGAVLFFFLSVGETYSVTSMLGFPGGVYAKGGDFITWFFGYILLAAPVLYCVGPVIWRAGVLYGAATIPDFFRSHFDSRALELVMAGSAILLLVPVGTTQFMGLKIVLASLGLPVAPVVLLALAGGMAFLYVVIAGLRASAFVAILKDVLMLSAILLVSGAAIAHWHIDGGQADGGQVGGAAALAASVPAGGDHKGLVFALSTMVLQAAGFAMIPQTWAFLFSARDPGAIRRAQVVSPLYLLLFPLLMCVAFFARFHGLQPPQPDFVFITTAQALLPEWVVGVVLATITLSGLVLLSSVCLAISPLVTRNIVSGLNEAGQRRWAKVVTALYILLSIIGTEVSGKFIVTLNNIFYFGIAQSLPAFFAALFLPRVRASAVILGMAAGYATAFWIYLAAVDVGGLNAGLVGLVLNTAVMLTAAALHPRRQAATLLTRLRAAPSLPSHD